MGFPYPLHRTYLVNVKEPLCRKRLSFGHLSVLAYIVGLILSPKFL